MCTVHEFIKTSINLTMDIIQAGLANPVSIKGTLVSLDTEGQFEKGRIQAQVGGVNWPDVLLKKRREKGRGVENKNK